MANIAGNRDDSSYVSRVQVKTIPTPGKVNMQFLRHPAPIRPLLHIHAAPWHFPRENRPPGSRIVDLERLDLTVAPAGKGGCFPDATHGPDVCVSLWNISHHHILVKRQAGFTWS